MLQAYLDFFGSPTRMHGVSKEKRADLPLVSIALVIDEHAIPIDFQIFAGNQAGTSTMIHSIRNLKQKYGKQKAVLVADSALSSTKNLQMLLDEGLGFSVAKSALSYTSNVINNELNLDEFFHVLDADGNPTSFLYKVIPFNDTKYDRSEKDDNGKYSKYSIDCKLLITFIQERMNRDLATLEANIQRARQAVQRKEKVHFAINGWKQFAITKEKMILLKMIPPQKLYRMMVRIIK